MNDEKQFSYTIKNEEIKEEQIIREEAVAYGAKPIGESTLENYYALPDDVRVELIDGVFYDMSAPTTIHQIFVSEVHRILKNYVEKKRGKCIPLVSPVDVQLDCDDKTMVQPDVLVICDRDKVIRRCVYGAPDFIAEVMSPSTSRKDSVIKLRKYKEAGVREYWMVDSDKKRVIVYDWSKGDIPKIYSFKDKVPVGIFDGECEIDFVKLFQELEWLYDKE